MQQNTQVHQVQVQPQPVVQQHLVVASLSVCQDYACKTARILGILQIVTGILCMLLQVVAIFLASAAATFSAGIWCGIFFIVTGALGVVSSYKKTTEFIVTFMVMSIVSAAFILAIVTCTLLSVQADVTYKKYLPGLNAKIVINSLLLGLALCELVFAIWSSVLGCKVCCFATYGPQVLVVAPGQALADQHGGVVVQGAPGFAYPGQPVSVQQHVQHQPLEQNAPLGYTDVAPPMYQQHATVPQYQGAPSGGEHTSSQKQAQSQGEYVKLEEDH